MITNYIRTNVTKNSKIIITTAKYTTWLEYHKPKQYSFPYTLF